MGVSHLLVVLAHRPASYVVASPLGRRRLRAYVYWPFGLRLLELAAQAFVLFRSGRESVCVSQVLPPTRLLQELPSLPRYMALDEHKRLVS